MKKLLWMLSLTASVATRGSLIDPSNYSASQSPPNKTVDIVLQWTASLVAGLLCRWSPAAVNWPASNGVCFISDPDSDRVKACMQLYYFSFTEHVPASARPISSFPHDQTRVKLHDTKRMMTSISRIHSVLLPSLNFLFVSIYHSD